VFISVGQFEHHMGVNKIIARFFVDRKPPENNVFWEGKLLYIGFGNGYVSIPVFYDILFRIGIPLETLLDEEHIRLMERLMHFAILQEKNEISIPEELKCVRALLKGRVKDPECYDALNRYLDQPVLKPLGIFGMKHPSLNRADVFLYILCDLPITGKQWALATRYWYALHPSYLIVDDIQDYEKDLAEGEENVIINLGGGAEGFKKTFDMLYENVEIMKEINPQLAQALLDYDEFLKDFVPLK